MAKDTPQPRPALSRAPDAGVHPVSARPIPEPPSLRPLKGGAATSDTLRGAAKDKLVDLGVRVPKSVRKRVKAEAKARGMSMDEVVTLLLLGGLPPASRT
jgi:hypothetical protein